MRRIAIAVAATVSIVVLLFSYHTSTDSGGLPVAVGQPRPVVRTAAPSSPAAPSTEPSSGASPAPSSGSSGASGTFTGDPADTQYGPVQVQITVSGGRITAAQTLQVPQESNRDVRINSAAVPILNQEALTAQSAQIDTVSGATYTSEGYAQSLQSAIDAAHR
ncbi:MAG TPA: FMN-binding protein [Amycolatopsis sp.]